MHPLRQFVREHLEQLLEMPYAGTKPTVFGKEPQMQSRLASFAGDTTNLAGVHKYMQSSKWKKLAKQAYVNFPYPVWIVPFAGAELDSSLSTIHGGFNSSMHGMGRGQLMTHEEAAGLFDSLGVDVSDIEPDAFIVFAISTVAAKDILPSPWMIFHAIFDDDVNDAFDLNTYSVLNDVFEGEMVDDLDLPGAGFPMAALMTMKSAREELIDNEGDAIAELMCQAILTHGGVKFRTELVDDNHEVLEWLADVKRRVDALGREVIQRAKGKVLIISVA